MSNQDERRAHPVRVRERVVLSPPARIQPSRPEPLVIRFVPRRDPDVDRGRTPSSHQQQTPHHPVDAGPWEDRT
ncbi:hypothetical protein [Euzebya sp.]|uniref:hypothetical protein n=1 Tax=Euzebya sp. TaxID=1971409 RepID=UPI0035120C62